MNQILLKISKIAFYGLLALFYVLTFLQTTMYFTFARKVMGAVPWLIWLLPGFAVLAAGLEFFHSAKGARDKGVFALKLAMIVLCAAVTLNGTAFLPLTALVLLAVSAHLAEEDKVLKLGFYLGTAIVVVLFFLSLLGLVPNNRGTAFGFLYRTDYAGHLFALALLWCLLKDGFLSWLGELALIGLALFLGLAVGGRTDCICLLLLILATQCRHYRRAGGVPYQEGYGVVIPLLFRFLYLPARGLCFLAKKWHPGRWAKALRYSFIAAAVLSFLLTLSYRPLRAFWTSLPGLETIASRLYYGTLAFAEYPLTLLGNDIPEMGNALLETDVATPFFLDNAYVRLLLVCGIGMLAAFVTLMTLAQWRLYKEKRYYAVFGLSILAMGSILEPFSIGLSYNLFALLAFCVLSRKPGLEACRRCRPGDLPVRRRMVLGILSLVLCLVLGTWCVTAYRISSWRGHKALYDATLVVPDAKGNARLQQIRLTAVKDYLLTDLHAHCILTSQEEKQLLMLYDIRGDRIHVLAYSDAIEMLTRAQSLIASEGLPPRLTICTFAVEQEAIRRRAEALHIPVNSLTMPLPRELYLKCFTEQQWNLLWGKD